jgi:putative ABC transport system permease protein
MRGVSLSRLVRLSLAREGRGALFSVFGVAVGVGALVFFVALGLGVGRVIRERVFPTDARLLDVVPPAVSLGGLLGGGKLDAATVERLAALEGVERVHRKMAVRVPTVTRYDGPFFGAHLRIAMEIPAVVGVEGALVQPDVQRGTFEERGPDASIPVLVSTRLLEIYNKTFAPSRRLPQLAVGMVVGFSFPVEFNRSWVGVPTSGPSLPTRMEIVGASDRAPLAALTVPLEAARRLNRALGVDAETYSGLTLVARSPAAVPRLAEAVREMGLEIDDQERRLAQNAGVAVALTTSALALLSVLICLLAAVNITHALSASVRARAREIGVMQAVGASRADIRALVLAEAAVVGLAGGVGGTLAALALAAGVDALAARFLPPFPFKPDTFFSFPAWVALGGVALGLLAALAGAYFPSRRAAATDPARTLSG